MATIFKPTFSRVDPKTGRKKVRKLRKWYVKYKDADGIERRVPGYRDKEATRAYGTELERKAARRHVGLSDPFEDQLKRPLIEHLADYKVFLASKGNTSKPWNRPFNEFNRS